MVAAMLGAADIVVCVLYFALTIVIGKHSGDAVDSMDEYFVAGRSMGSCAVSLSSMAALYSGLTLLGSPGYVYVNGPVTALALLSIIVWVPITVLVIPVFHRAGITSAYEYLELRFNRRLRIVGASLFVLRIVSYLGSALYVPAVAVEAVAQVPRWPTIVLTGTVSAAYTVAGGMRAVIWTDIMQFFVLSGALMLVAGAATWKNGIGGTLAINAAADHLKWFDPNPDPTVTFSVYAVFIGGIAGGLVQTISDQIAVQRILSAATATEATRAYVSCGPIQFRFM